MRHSYLKRKEGEDAFTDLLFNALLGFAFMFVTAFSLISEPSEGGKITPNAEILPKWKAKNHNYRGTLPEVRAFFVFRER